MHGFFAYLISASLIEIMLCRLSMQSFNIASTSSVCFDYIRWLDLHLPECLLLWVCWKCTSALTEWRGLMLQLTQKKKTFLKQLCFK